MYALDSTIVWSAQVREFPMKRFFEREVFAVLYEAKSSRYQDRAETVLVLEGEGEGA